MKKTLILTAAVAFLAVNTLEAAPKGQQLSRVNNSQSSFKDKPTIVINQPNIKPITVTSNHKPPVVVNSGPFVPPSYHNHHHHNYRPYFPPYYPWYPTWYYPIPVWNHCFPSWFSY